jgi:hypothetical protein
LATVCSSGRDQFHLAVFGVCESNPGALSRPRMESALRLRDWNLFAKLTMEFLIVYNVPVVIGSR